MKTKNDVLMDNMLNDIINTTLYPNRSFERSSKFMPPLNISDVDATYVIELYAPSMRKSDFDIQITGSILTISAETSTSAEKESNYILKEIEFYNFSRSIKLSKDINTENINAKYKNGVLTITLKKEELKINKIEVK